MLIDQLYVPETNNDSIKYNKSNFYLGKVSYIKNDFCRIQVENLSILNQRKMYSETIHPGTINYNIVIDSNNGLFIGKVIESKIKSNDSVHTAFNDDNQKEIYPDILVKLKAKINSNRSFQRISNKTVSINDKSYVSTSIINDLYLESLSKKTKDQNTLNNFAVKAITGKSFEIDVNNLFKNHLLVLGSTNTGKSTSSLSIIDDLIKKDKKTLIIDPTGEYNKSFNNDSKVNHLEIGVNCGIKKDELSISEWCNIFGANNNSQPAVLLEALKILTFKKDSYIKKDKTVKDVEKDLYGYDDLDSFDFDFDKLCDQIRYDSVKESSTKYSTDAFALGSNLHLINKIKFSIQENELKKYFIDSSDGSLDNLLSAVDSFVNEENSSLYIDVSNLADNINIEKTIVNLILSRIFKIKNRQISRKKPFITFIDEAHRYIAPEESNNPLSIIAKEGRKYGIYLFLSTQRPSDINSDIISQIGTFIVHRLWNDSDLQQMRNALSPESISDIKLLETGNAILSSVNLIDDLEVHFNKSNRDHCNRTPPL